MEVTNKKTEESHLMGINDRLKVDNFLVIMCGRTQIMMQIGIQIEIISYLCTDECVSPSLKSPKSMLGKYEAQTAVHIDGLPICAYLRTFGDA